MPGNQNGFTSRLRYAQENIYNVQKKNTEISQPQQPQVKIPIYKSANRGKGCGCGKK